MEDLIARLGRIDIYLLDQILRGRLVPGQRVLDAGCGGGRNIAYLLRAGYDVSAVDQSDDAITGIRAMAAELAPTLPETQLRVAPVERLPFDDEAFDVVISCAVLHFAEDEAHFDAMLAEMMRVLRPQGLFFARLASSIGIEDRIRPTEGRRYDLPDGSNRFLVDEDYLLDRTERFGGTLLDPIKTTNVQGLRCMTTWVVRLE